MPLYRSCFGPQLMNLPCHESRIDQRQLLSGCRLNVPIFDLQIFIGLCGVGDGDIDTSVAGVPAAVDDIFIESRSCGTF